MIISSSARRASSNVTSNGLPYAELPRVEVDVSYSLPVGGQSHNPNTSAELNTLLTGGTLDGKTLALGDVVTLDAGTTYAPADAGVNFFTIPALTGSGWVYVISSALASLPAFGTRVAPADASNMPRIQAKDSGEGYPAIAVTAGSKNFRFVGIELRSSQTTNFTYNLIDLGNGATVEANLASYIYFDRCYIHGSTTIGGIRGIAMNGKNCAAVHCYLTDFKNQYSDTQAIAVWDGVGGHRIENNFLAGAGEVFQCGGSDPTNVAWVASDITFRGNHFYKPLAWRGATPSISIKNHMELKFGKRFLIERNFFENFWEDAQAHSFNIAEINQGGPHTAAIVEDITVRLNKWDKAGNWMTICFGGCGGNGFTTGMGGRVHVVNNLVTNLNREAYGGYAQPIQLNQNPRDVYVYHNTCIFAGATEANCAVSASGAAGTGVHIDNNIFWNGTYGLKGDGGQNLEYYWDDWTCTSNVLVGGTENGDGNFNPVNEAAVGFVGSGDYTLSGGSSYKNAGTDGLDLGCTNVTLVEAYATAAINGTAS